jgi:hypothetical protein
VLHDKFIVDRNGKRPWLAQAFVRTVRSMEHHDAISSGIFADEFLYEGPWEWTKQHLKIFHEA